MVAVRCKVEPDVCTYIDEHENSFTIEVVLPGVDKETIRLKVNTRCLILFAEADNVNYAKYLSFCYPVEADKAEAMYEHGLLRIKVPVMA
ncbi:MAG: Hsp20/alpha crystallin family protein [bacterium]